MHGVELTLVLAGCASTPATSSATTSPGTRAGSAAPTSAPIETTGHEVGARKPQHTSLTLPLTHLDQSHDLLALLGPMGLPLAGDYSGLGASVVSRAIQKDVMTVDQLGTAAARSTGVSWRGGGSSEPSTA